MEINTKKRIIVGTIISLAIAILCLIGRADAGYFDRFEAWKLSAHMMAEEARAEGASEDDVRIVSAKKEWAENQTVIDYQLDMLARVVYFEAGNCTDRHQQLVARVLLNRCEFDERFPDTIPENVYRRGQYACAPYLYTVTRERIPERCYTNAWIAAYGEVECPPDVIFQAEFRQGTGVYEFHYNTYFCYG